MRTRPPCWAAFALTGLLLAGPVGVARAGVPASTAARARGLAPAAADIPVSTSDLTRFVGGWVAPSARMTVRPTGLIIAVVRTYTWCGPRVAPPCDVLKGNIISAGVRVSAKIQTIRGVVARALVLTSTVPRTVGTVLTLQLLPPSHLLTHAPARWLDRLYLCRSRYAQYGASIQRSVAACG